MPSDHPVQWQALLYVKDTSEVQLDHCTLLTSATGDSSQALRELSGEEVRLLRSSDGRVCVFLLEASLCSPGATLQPLQNVLQFVRLLAATGQAGPLVGGTLPVERMNNLPTCCKCTQDSFAFGAANGLLRKVVPSLQRFDTMILDLTEVGRAGSHQFLYNFPHASLEAVVKQTSCC